MKEHKMSENKSDNIMIAATAVGVAGVLIGVCIMMLYSFSAMKDTKKADQVVITHELDVPGCKSKTFTASLDKIAQHEKLLKVMTKKNRKFQVELVKLRKEQVCCVRISKVAHTNAAACVK